MSAPGSVSASIFISSLPLKYLRDRRGERRLGDSTDENPLRGGLRIGKVDPEGIDASSSTPLMIFTSIGL
jgi:hypothetical protein